jgi:hypothetical protein
MSRASLAVSFVVLMALATPVFPGPPEGPSGALLLDEVADGLRRHTRGDGSGDQRRIEWLKKVVRTRDPRVVIALFELAFDGQSRQVQDEATFVIWAHIIRRPGAAEPLPSDSAKLKALRDRARDWWRENGQLYLLQADQLP